MSRHRSAAKLVNMSGKQTYDDIVDFISDESYCDKITNNKFFEMRFR